MEDLRKINKILGFISLIPIVCWGLIILIGCIYFGGVPKYGMNPDPYGLGVSWLEGIATLSASFCFLTIPISILLTIHLLLNGIRFNKSELVSSIASLVSIVIFFTLKFIFPATFNWVMD